MNRKLAAAAALCAMAALIFSAKEAAAACLGALEVCGRMIIPALFPFFVLSILLNRLGLPGILGKSLAPFASKLYGISGAGASALLIGLTGGYPLGAAYIADMEKQGSITANEGERLLGFCNNSGPAFIIGAVGSGVFGSAKIGLLLYAVHIFSALMTGLFFRSRSFCGETQPVLLEGVDTGAVLPEAVKQAVASILNVCGFVLCFSVIVGLLDAKGLFSLACGFLASQLGWELHFSRALLTGVLEIGSAAGAMAGLSLTPHSLALAAGVLGWGGLSVHFQTLAVLAGSKIKGALHLTGRLISASIAAATAYIIGVILF